MNFNELLKNNAKASDMVPRFRAGTAEDEFYYIEMLYNRTRRHNDIGGVSPEAFERASK